MTRTTYYVASTLDGFIADEHDALDWLFRQQIDDDGPMGYPAFISGIGALLMGSTTYEWVRTHDDVAGGWPYEQPCWVFTHRDLPRIEGADLRFASGDVAEVWPEVLAAAGGSGSGEQREREQGGGRGREQAGGAHRSSEQDEQDEGGFHGAPLPRRRQCPQRVRCGRPQPVGRTTS